MICPTGEAKYFCKRDSTSKSPDSLSGKSSHSTRARKFEDFLLDLQRGPFRKPLFSDSSARWRRDVFW
jgi:hypothetical protein